MNQRQEKLSRLLSEAGRWMTGKELAAILCVSDRTIRSDIAVILEEHPSYRIVSSRRYGYRMENIGFVSIPSKDGPVSMHPVNSDERCQYILKTLLDRDGEVCLTVLEQEMFFSDSSIDIDIKKIKHIVKDYPNLILRRSNRVLYLSGPEQEKRALYQNMLLNCNAGNMLNFSALVTVFSQIDYPNIWKNMKSIIKKYHYCVRENQQFVLALYLGIAVERILKYHCIREDACEGISLDTMVERVEYQIAGEFFRVIEKEYYRVVPVAEIYYLALFLTNGQDFSPDMEERVNGLLEEVLEEVYHVYQLDFRGDKELVRLLRHHITVLLNQNWVNDFEFPLSDSDIRMKYPLSFEIACFLSNYLKEKTEHTIAETEIGYIALHLQCAYERLYKDEKHRILIISPYNQGLLAHCLERLKLYFGERIMIAACLPMFEEENVKSEHPDLILTTLPLKHNLGIPTIQISIFLNMEEENRIFCALNQLDLKLFQTKYQSWMVSLVRPEFFYTGVEAETPEEVICFLCGQLQKAGCIEEGFLASVLEREKLCPTAFDFEFSLPHSMNVSSRESVLSVAFLKKPILWGKYEVTLVLLPAICEEDRRCIEVLFNWLGSMVSDNGRLAELMESRSWERFQKLFY